MKRIVQVIFSFGLIFIIGVSDIDTKNEVEAQSQLIITPMTYEQWSAHRTKLGYPVTMTKSEWIEMGYHR